MQSGKIFIRNTLWYFIPFLIMTIIAIVSQNYTFQMMQSQNYEIVQKQLIRDMEEIEADIYSGRKIAIEMSMDSILSEENMDELGLLSIRAFDRIGEYRIRMDICSTLFMCYSPEKLFDENGSTSLDAYCQGIQQFTEDSEATFRGLLAARQDANCVLENMNGVKHILLLYYFPADTYEEERWVGFWIKESKIESRLQNILGDMDSHLILTYGDQNFVELDQLSEALSAEELSHLYDVQESKDGRISGYTAMLHQGKVYDMKMYVLLNNSIFTKTVRQEQVKILAISIITFVALTLLLWTYSRYQYKKSQAVQQLAVNMYPEIDREGIRGEYDLIQKVLERDFERLSYHDQMLDYFRKESKRQLTWLLLKSTPPEEFQIEELMENCGINDDGYYYAVLDFLLASGEDSFDFLEDMDKVLMYHLDKSEFGVLLMVVVALESRDEKHDERLAITEMLLQKLKSADYICRGVSGGLVYGQLVEIHNSQEEAFSMLDTLAQEKRTEQTRVFFFDEIAQVSKRVPHITADILQQFKDALLGGQEDKALKTLSSLLAPPKAMAEELLTYVRYKIIQIMLDVWQAKGIAQDSINNLLQLVKLEDDAFKMEVENSIKLLTAGSVIKDIDSKEVLDYVTQHALDSEISINGIADYFGISERSVSRIMKDNLNKTYKEYISELRLNKACQMLEESTLDIQTIARQVGYYNVTSFNRLFKQMYDVSPGEYRNIVKK